MFFLFKRKSFANDYLFMTTIVIIAVIGLSIIFSLYTYISEQRVKKTQLVDATNRIAMVLDNSFAYTTQLGDLIGTKIVEQGSDNPAVIANILGGKLVYNEIAKKIFALTIFDWVTTDYQMIVSGPYGVLKESRDVSFRNYAKMATKQPNKLHFDLPSIGIPSGQYIMPAGMGITDHNDNFKGILTVGFDVSKFITQIEEDLPDSRGISYVILASDFTPIIKSLNTDSIDGDKEFFIKELSTQIRYNTASDTHGFLDTEITYNNNITYQYYRALDNYPFIVLVGYDDVFLRHEMNGILIPSIAEFMCIGSISILVLVMIRRLIVNPIVQLAESASKIARGEKNIKILYGYSEEIDNLSHHLEKVAFYMEELRNTQAALTKSLNETELARGKVKEANESLEQKVIERTMELEKALQAKTEFLNNMSHEIKTPVHGVTNFADLLVEDWEVLDEAKRKDFAIKIQKNSDRLYSLVSNLLDLSQLSASKMQFIMKKFNLTDIVQGAIEECEPLYLNNKDIRLTLLVEPAELVVKAKFDKERITQVLRNLFSNAIKFTPSGNIIATIHEKEITYADGRVVLGIGVSVEDEGIAIPEDELSLIFDAFSQSSRTKTKAGGTGLGLSICYEIIAAHKGNIWACNNQYKGSTVTFVIPYQ